jgi:protein-disulfide isomerase-like protein with CxxC motif
VADLHVLIYTDPACPWSWAAEPALRHIQTMFGDGLEITYVMGGLARTFARPLHMMRH